MLLGGKTRAELSALPSEGRAPSAAEQPHIRVVRLQKSEPTAAEPPKLASAAS